MLKRHEHAAVGCLDVLGVDHGDVGWRVSLGLENEDEEAPKNEPAEEAG